MARNLRPWNPLARIFFELLVGLTVAFIGAMAFMGVSFQVTGYADPPYVDEVWWVLSAVALLVVCASALWRHRRTQHSATLS